MKKIGVLDTLLLSFLLISVFMSLGIGPGPSSFSETIDWFRSINLNSSSSFILSELRFPRTMATIGVGASLAVSGLLLQTLLRNPLAEPYTLGISGGATLGAVSAFLWNPSPSMTLVAALSFGGCWLASGIVILWMRRSQYRQDKNLILVGVMLSLFSGSLVTVGFSYFQPAQISRALLWMMGSFGSSRDGLWFLSIGIAILVVAFWSLKSHWLDGLLLPEDLARSSGIPILKIKILIVITVSFLVSMSVVIAGLLGFVGLVAPHFIYLLVSSRRHRSTLVPSALLGALLTLLADCLGRFVGGDREIPVGAVVALIGTPMLITLLLRRGGYASRY